jgi:membrane-bound lytic murein transglycosylase D
MRATWHACIWIAAAGIIGISGCAPVAHKPFKPAPYAGEYSSIQNTARQLELQHPSWVGNGQDADVEPLFETGHPRVQSFVAAYQAELRETFARSLERGLQYLPTISSILAEEGVPPELAYLPIIESGFRLNAVSPAGAVGPWQFIRGTGKRYGLRIDRYVDERRDPEKATRAAARYLRDLHDMFEDWHLSLAAYNTGEANVARIRNTAQIDDYWEMVDRGYLPSETRQYVPRALAAMEIAASPEEYGFEKQEGSPTRYDQVVIDKAISLKTVAELSGTSLEQVTELNPALCRGVVPPSGYEVRIPKGSLETFEVAYANYDFRKAAVPWDDVPDYKTHRVRKGETLGGIAKRYNVTAAALIQANKLGKAKRIQVGKTLRIPIKRKSTGYRSFASGANEPRSRTLN